MRVSGWPGRLLLLASLGALAVSGGVRAAVALTAAFAMLLPPPPLSGVAWLGGHAGVLTVTGLLAATGQGEEGLAVLVAWLAVHRQWTARTTNDGRIGVLFATLLVLLAALGSEAFALGVFLAAYVAMLPLALLRIELGRPGGLRAAAVSVAVAALTAGIYVLLPRLQGGYLARAPGTAVPDTVTLGDDFGDLADQAVVLHLRVTDRSQRRVPGPFHIRGRALDRFDGTRWTSSFEPAPAPQPDSAHADLFAEVELEPMSGGVLFGVPEVLGVRGMTGGVRVDENGTFVHRRPPGKYAYLALSRTESLADELVLTDAQEIAYLSLPPVDRRVADLALSIAPSEQDPRRVAQALTDWLSVNVAYVEAPPPPEGDPLVDFLFVRKAGHCEYFASALAVMLRVRGVPSRLATGFWSGELDEDGETIVVRRGQAHAWVEVPLASGWTEFDPSPIAGRPTLPVDSFAALVGRWYDGWNRWVIDYNLDRQVEALAELGKAGAGATGRPSPSWPAWSGLWWLGGALGTAYAVALGLQLFAGRILVPSRAPRGGVLAGEVRAARRIAARRGWRIPDALPPLAAAEWLAAQAGPTAEPFRERAWVVYRARYGGETDGAAAKARGCVRALRGLARRAEPVSTGSRPSS